MRIRTDWRESENPFSPEKDPILLVPAISSAKGPVINRFSWENNPEFFADCAAAGYGDYMIVGSESSRSP